MMVHFGLYSIPVGEWKAKRMGNILGEWIQSYFRIPNAEYHALAKVVDPIYFDAEEWIHLAKEGGYLKRLTLKKRGNIHASKGYDLQHPF